jgi:hypothetical protein
MSALRFLCEMRTTLVAVAVAHRGTSAARATDTHQFPHGDAFSCQLFDVFPVKINTFITNRDIAWPCSESVDLILTFPAEGTHREGAPLWLVVHPHRSSTFLRHRAGLHGSSTTHRSVKLARYTTGSSPSSMRDFAAVRPLMPAQMTATLRLPPVEGVLPCSKTKGVSPSTTLLAHGMVGLHQYSTTRQGSGDQVLVPQ